MIYRFDEQAINDYYDRIGINQSAIKVLLFKGFQQFIDELNGIMRSNELYYEEKEHFNIGQAVDTYMTRGEQVFADKFHITQVPKPRDKSLAITKMVFDRLLAKQENSVPYDVQEGSGFMGTTPNPIVPAQLRGMEFFKKEVYDAMNEVEYFMNRKKPTAEEDTRMATLLKDGICQGYFKDLWQSIGKQLLDDEEGEKSQAIIMSLRTHVHTKELFEDSADKDIIYQLPLYWEYEGVDLKSLLDKVDIHHKTGVIIPQDIKSTGEYVLNFPNAIKKFRYDLQGSFYTEALKRSLEYISELVGKDVRNYRVANFGFIAESTKKPGTPLVYVLDDDLLHTGRYGDGRFTLGWEHGIAEYKRWAKVEFSIEKMFEDNAGIVPVNKDYKIQY